MGDGTKKSYDEDIRRERIQMANWMRTNRIAAVLLVVVRFYLGWKWIEAGWHKIVDGFSAAGFLNKAIETPVLATGTENAMYPNFVAFLKHFALPNVELINVLIPWGEFLVGLGLILGGLTVTAAFFGMMMNFMFLLAGTVSSNPWLILFGIVVLLAGNNAGKFGLDYYLLPWIKRAYRHIVKRKHPTDPAAPVNRQGVAG